MQAFHDHRRVNLVQLTESKLKRRYPATKIDDTKYLDNVSWFVLYQDLQNTIRVVDLHDFFFE